MTALNTYLGNRLKLLLVLGLAAIVVAGATYLETSLKDRQTDLDASVSLTRPQVGENISVAVNTDSNLEFGTIPAGASAEKTIDVSADRLTRLDTVTTGNISGALDADHERFLKGDSKVKVTAGTNTSGYFSGQLTIKTSTATNGANERWLELQRYLRSYY